MKNLRLIVFAVMAFAIFGSFERSASAQPAQPSQASSSPAAKKKKLKKKHSSKREPSQKAPTPDRISEIQSALAKGGYYQGAPNGKWDSDTVTALEKFQSSHGIDASGKLDASTLQKLGLGSDIAGVSAPTHPQPTTSPAASPSARSPSSPPLSSSTTNSGSSVSTDSASASPGSALK